MFDCPSIALIVLAYNEEESLPALLDESVTWLEANVPTWELLVVDDGSTDGTRQVAAEWAARHAQVRLLTHDTNRGMGAGTKTGIRAAQSEYFSIIAGDGQHPPSALGAMIPALSEADIVTTTHIEQRETHRRLLSWGFRKAMQWACGIDFTQEGLFLFPTRIAVEQIGLDAVPPDTFFFSFELIARALRLGYSSAVRPIHVRRRQHGASKVAGAQKIRRIFSEIRDFRRRLQAER